MVNNLYRVTSVLIYPLILFVVFSCVYKNKYYKNTIKNNLKTILINTFIYSFVFILLIVVFFSFEKTIYSWDFSGHWVRSLTLRDIFFSNPQNLFNEIYKSINYSDYSYLPALFTLPFTIINTSYSFFCVGNFMAYFIPLFILFQIIYFKYFNKYKFLPLIISLIFFPLYYPLLEGKPCGCGLIFITVSYMLLIFQDVKDIKIHESLLINLFMYIAIFERRWYLYSAFVLYLSFLLKYMLSIKTINNKFTYFITRVLFSGIVLLIVLLFFNMPFLQKVLTNNYSEIYSTYNKNGKLFSFIDYYSILILLIYIFGLFYLFKHNKQLFIILVLSLVVSTAMFWSIQSFETHHYYISMINIIIPFSIGIYFLLSYISKVGIAILAILLIQATLIFVNIKAIPIFTSLKRIPQQMDNIDKYYDFCLYIKKLLGENDSAYICGSSPTFNEDIIRNSQLPDLEMPTFEYAQVDLVDGFPNNIDYIRYILIPKPFQYYDKNSQHVHEILANAIQNKDEFKKIYKLLDTYQLGSISIDIYIKQGDYSQSMKQYLFNEIIKFYPNNVDIFKEILE